MKTELLDITLGDLELYEALRCDPDMMRALGGPQDRDNMPAPGRVRKRSSGKNPVGKEAFVDDFAKQAFLRSVAPDFAPMILDVELVTDYVREAVDNLDEFKAGLRQELPKGGS